MNTRGQTDARGLIHGFKHVIDQLANAVVDRRHWFGDGAKARIGKFEDV
jgi:hypothetical protein